MRPGSEPQARRNKAVARGRGAAPEARMAQLLKVRCWLLPAYSG
jgi:hypothetical protein